VIKDEDVRIAYVAGTTVPKDWIPFMLVHAKDSVSEIRLQRARMAGGSEPRGRLLREVRSPYFIEEEYRARAFTSNGRGNAPAGRTAAHSSRWAGRRRPAAAKAGATSCSIASAICSRRKDSGP
jgi:hypothetical protein